MKTVKAQTMNKENIQKVVQHRHTKRTSISGSRGPPK